MRLLRKGMNAVSCVFSISDIAYLGYNPNSILAQTSVMTEELQGLTSFAMHVVSNHFVPISIPMGLPLEVHAAWYPQEIELCIMAPLPFELFDLPADCDMEVDIAEYDADEANAEEVFLFDEEDETSEEMECEEDDFAEDIENEVQQECLVAFVFQTLNDVSSYVKVCVGAAKPLSSDVYKDDAYWLICRFSNAKFVNTYLYVASEWNGKYENNGLRIAHIKEHGKHVIKEKAFDILLNL